MKQELRKIKSFCKTAGQMRAFNELIETFATDPNDPYPTSAEFMKGKPWSLLVYTRKDGSKDFSVVKSGRDLAKAQEHGGFTSNKAGDDIELVNIYATKEEAEKEGQRKTK